MTDVIEGEVVEPATSAVVVHQAPEDRTKAIALWEVGGLSDDAFQERVTLLTKGVERIAALQRSLLSEGIENDYGMLPGTKRTVLLKPGAEKLAMFYRMVPRFEERLTVDLPTPHPDFPVMPERLTVHVRTFLHHGSQEGPIVGEGVGVASSYEAKYLWRSRAKTCPSCGVDGLRRSKAEYGGGYYCPKDTGCGANFRGGTQQANMIDAMPTGRVPNMEPWELLNTITKIATKRSFVDGVIRALGASALFTQDIEDLIPRPDGGGEAPAVRSAPAVQSPKRATPEPQRAAPPAARGGDMHEGTVKAEPDGVREIKAPEWATGMRADDVTDKAELVLTVGRSKHTAVVLGPLAHGVLELAPREGDQARVFGQRVELDYPGRGDKPMRKEIRNVTRVALLREGAWVDAKAVSPDLPLAEPDDGPGFDDADLPFPAAVRAPFDPMTLAVHQEAADTPFDGVVGIIAVQSKIATSSRKPYARIDALVSRDARIVIVMDDADAQACDVYGMGRGEQARVVGTWAQAGDSTVVMTAAVSRV